MSQRGSRPKRTPHNTAPPWGQYIRRILVFTLSLTLGTTLTLIAQNTKPPTISTKTVIVHVDGTVREVSTQKDTVQTLLHQEGITLNPHDLCEPPPTASVVEGMTVTVTRVTFETIRERVAIPPPVIMRWDRRMTEHPVVIREGRPGVAEQTHCIWKKDGVVSEQWVQSKHTVAQPTPTIVVKGALPSRSGVTGRRIITVVATAYDPGPGSCGRFASGRTAIGLRAARGVIAVDPRVIPLGTRVYVDGYGPAVAADVGSAIKGHRIDVCFPSRSEAMRWGRRTVTVVVLQ